MMRGLLIRSPWIDEILAGKKTWEIRGINTHIRGSIALIRSGSGQIYGTCDIVDVRGPLTLTEMIANVLRHREPLEELKRGLPYERTYAWILDNIQLFTEPVPYKHPSGAITWVKLQEPTLAMCQIVNKKLVSIANIPSPDRLLIQRGGQQINYDQLWFPWGNRGK